MAYRNRPYVRMVECEHCGRVIVCTELSRAYGRTIWQCDEGHVFDDGV